MAQASLIKEAKQCGGWETIKEVYGCYAELAMANDLH